ncbi:hypothetical protein CATMIT_01781, partial [Catenibacterium mitsuokai DSM 15897]
IDALRELVPERFGVVTAARKTATDADDGHRRINARKRFHSLGPCDVVDP